MEVPKWMDIILLVHNTINRYTQTPYRISGIIKNSL